jgi:hypothetical protein
MTKKLRQKISKEKLLIAYQEAQKRVSGQVEFRIAAQNKAASLASMFLMLATASMGFGFAQKGILFIWGLTCGILMLIGAGFCIFSCWARGFYNIGNDPDNWKPHIKSNKAMAQTILDDMSAYGERIKFNSAAIRSDNKIMNLGIIISFSAPAVASIVSILAWVAVPLIRPALDFLP